MVEIINLNRHRKAAARAKAEAEKRRYELDQHRREAPPKE